MLKDKHQQHLLTNIETNEKVICKRDAFGIHNSKWVYNNGRLPEYCEIAVNRDNGYHLDAVKDRQEDCLVHK